MKTTTRIALTFVGGILFGFGVAYLWLGLSVSDAVQAGNTFLQLYMNRPKVIAFSIVSIIAGGAMVLGPSIYRSTKEDGGYV